MWAVANLSPRVGGQLGLCPRKRGVVGPQEGPGRSRRGPSDDGEALEQGAVARSVGPILEDLVWEDRVTVADSNPKAVLRVRVEDQMLEFGHGWFLVLV